MSPPESEFVALRQTIAARGTARMVLLPVVVVGWAAVAGAVTLGLAPLSVLLSLAVLVAGFEAVYALHFSVERLGRYVQVFHEGLENTPGWETAAMSVGPALPGGGVDPLFTLVFCSTVILNFLLALPSPATVELGAIGMAHAAVIVRIVRARGAAMRQRTVELENFRAVSAGRSNRRDSTPIG
jgi:hypothetical protein